MVGKKTVVANRGGERADADGLALFQAVLDDESGEVRGCVEESGD